MNARPLDLGRGREFGDLVVLTLRLFREHAAVFTLTTLVVTAPVMIVVDGVWGGALERGGAAMDDVAWGQVAVSSLAYALVIPAFVTAIHASVLVRLARGEHVSTGQALRDALVRLAPAAGAAAIYALVTAVGFALLIAPGIYLAVRYYFCAQCAVVEGDGPRDAMRRSSRYVTGQWGSTFLRLLVVYVALALVSGIVEALTGGIDSGPLYVAILLAETTLTLSLTALFGSLLYFDVRYRATLDPLRAGGELYPAPVPATT